VRLSRALSGFWVPVGVTAVILALLLRFAIPVGYMPAGDGTLGIVPCPSGGPVPVAMPVSMAGMDMMPGMDMASMAHGDHGTMDHGHEPAKHQESTTCPFAAVSAPVLPPNPVLLARVDLPAFAELRPPVVRHLAVPTLAAPPPPSRGPPINS
jgi:hypothetical protein